MKPQRWPGSSALEGSTLGGIALVGSALIAATLSVVHPTTLHASAPPPPPVDIVEYAMPNDSYWPWDVAVAPDGSAWFAAGATKSDLKAGHPDTPGIGHIAPDGTLTLVALPSRESRPRGLVVAGTGKGYFADAGLGAVYNLGLTPGQVTPIGAIAANNPLDVAVSKDGTIWFTDFSGTFLGQLTLAAGDESTIPLAPAFDKPHDLVIGPDGAVWFTSEESNAIGRFAGGPSVEKYGLPTDEGEPRGICVGPDGALWFTEYESGKIGRITTEGTITEFAIPVAGAEPRGIAAGADGALWFTEYKTDQIGRVTTDGRFTFYRVPTDEASLRGIAAGPDGSVWFAEYRGHKIGRLRPRNNSAGGAERSPTTGAARVLPATGAAGASEGTWLMVAATLALIGFMIRPRGVDAN